MRHVNTLLAAAALVAAGATAYAADESDEAIAQEGVVVAELPISVSDSITIEQQRVIHALLTDPAPLIGGSV